MDYRNETQNHSLHPDKEPDKQVEANCQVCNVASTEGSQFCPQCGRQLVSRDAIASPGKIDEQEFINSVQIPSPSRTPAVSVKPQPLNDGDLQCACGQDLPADAKFCLQCGKPLGQSLPQYSLIFKGIGR